MFHKVSSILLASILAVSAIAETAKIVQNPEAKTELTVEQIQQQEKIQKRLAKKFQKQLEKQVIQVVWDEDKTVDSYTLYYGFKSRQYEFKIELDTSSSEVTLEAIPTGKIFYFAITSTTNGVESEHSEEISFTGGSITDIVIGKQKTKIKVMGEPSWKINLGYINQKGKIKYLKTIENKEVKFDITVPTFDERQYILIPQE